jgi:hypothetical protein
LFSLSTLGILPMTHLTQASVFISTPQTQCRASTEMTLTMELAFPEFVNPLPRIPDFPEFIIYITCIFSPWVGAAG